MLVIDTRHDPTSDSGSFYEDDEYFNYLEEKASGPVGWLVAVRPGNPMWKTPGSQPASGWLLSGRRWHDGHQTVVLWATRARRSTPPQVTQG